MLFPPFILHEQHDMSIMAEHSDNLGNGYTTQLIQSQATVAGLWFIQYPGVPNCGLSTPMHTHKVCNSLSLAMGCVRGEVEECVK